MRPWRGWGWLPGRSPRRTLSEAYVEVETRVEALLDAEGVELRGMAVGGMAIEVEPAVPWMGGLGDGAQYRAGNHRH
jgi:hypothetical protein